MTRHQEVLMTAIRSYGNAWVLASGPDAPTRCALVAARNRSSFRLRASISAVETDRDRLLDALTEVGVSRAKRSKILSALQAARAKLARLHARAS